MKHEAKCISNIDGHDIDIILLVETSKHDAKCILNTIKSQWPHTRSNIGWPGVTCIYCEGLENYIWVCKYDEYKR